MTPMFVHPEFRHGDNGEIFCLAEARAFYVRTAPPLHLYHDAVPRAERVCLLVQIHVEGHDRVGGIASACANEFR